MTVLEAKEANLSGQEELSGGLAHGQLPGLGSIFPRIDLPPQTSPPSKLDLGPLTCPGKLYQA